MKEKEATAVVRWHNAKAAVAALEVEFERVVDTGTRNEIVATRAKLHNAEKEWTDAYWDLPEIVQTTWRRIRFA